ncbi:hypothetical protein C8R43DRAFT_943152 [Mycena crocata]|nr:hypothetical protein C8R43DRAFT_943152 [Mycena crocata]
MPSNRTRTSLLDLPHGDQLKRQAHAQAQRRYRTSNLDETRAKARERMAKLRAARTPEQARSVAKKRRREDADYREQCAQISHFYLSVLKARKDSVLKPRLTSAQSKFRQKYGDDAFYGFYYPQYKLLGKKHLPGLYFGADEQAELNRMEKKHQKEVEKKKGLIQKKKASPGKENTAFFLISMAERRPTDGEFFHQAKNFDSRKEHDLSKRKMYFVVPDVGIFTLLTDALKWVETQDDVLPALTMKQALGIMDAHAKKVKTEVKVKTERKVKNEREELKREVSTPSPKRPLFTDDEDDEAPSVDPQQMSTFEDDGHTARRKRTGEEESVLAHNTGQKGAVLLRGKRARAGPGPSLPARTRMTTPARGPIRAPTVPLPDMSPSISTASSLSAASSGPTSVASHPFRNLGESASTAHRGGARASPPRASPPRAATAGTRSPSTATRGARPTTRGGSSRRGGAGSATARDDPTVHLGPSAAAALRSLSSGEPVKYKPATLKTLIEGRGSTSASTTSAKADTERLLWNHTQRTVYKDTEMAVQEMGTKETIQVVELDELVEYVSGKVPAA